MNSIQIFNNDKFGDVRWVKCNNKDYAVGKDVAKCLGYVNPRDAISSHCKGVVKHDSFKEGGQCVALIPEGDIYRLTAKSELPGAEKFESWIFDEVLPCIREKGTYGVGIQNNQKLINEFKGQIITLVDEIIQDKVNKIEEKCSTFFRPSAFEKSNISHYIKKRLGITKANEEYELVKERILIKLGATKWEDISIETLRSSLNLIDESIRIIKLDRPTTQLNMFELSNVQI